MSHFVSHWFSARLGLAAVGILCLASAAAAQPTYKLDVKANLKPLATLRLQGGQLRRSEVKDDPGFRLQYHFKKDGKTSAVHEARAQPAVSVPQKETGLYTVVLELFYPDYKGGDAQKGAFKPVSEVLTYRVEAGPKAGGPLKVTLLEAPRPTLVVQCGKGKGARQDEHVGRGYGYKLLQGTAFDAWPPSAGKTHCWHDPKLVRFEVSLPPGTAGTLRLRFVDGDGTGRKQKLMVLGKSVGEFAQFGGQGKTVDVALAAGDTKTGKVDVAVESLNPASTAVVSVVEFVPR